MKRDTIDIIDRRLIALLQANARESTTNLAKKLRLARTTVHERILRLERSGVVQGYTAVLSRDPFESYTQSHIMLNIIKAEQRAILRQLAELPEIRAVQAVNGECDLLCFAVTPLLEDLDALASEIVEIPGVNKMRSMIVMATKFDHRAGAENGRAALQAAAISQGEAG